MTLKHAFLITAHGGWRQLELLLKQIDHPNHDIFIHVDAKVKDYPKKALEEATKFSKVYAFSKRKVFWGVLSNYSRNLFIQKSPRIWSV